MAYDRIIPAPSVGEDGYAPSQRLASTGPTNLPMTSRGRPVSGSRDDDEDLSDWKRQQRHDIEQPPAPKDEVPTS